MGPHSTKDPVSRTVATYDQIAARYGVTATPELRAVREEAMNEFAARLPAKEVLVPCCGDGRDSASLSARGLNVLSFDLSAGMLKVACELNPQEQFLQYDVRNTASLGRTFDGIFACGCLYHLTKEDFIQTLQELHAALNPNGVVFLNLLAIYNGLQEEWRSLVPAGYPGGERASADLQGPRYYRYYEYDELKELLARHFAIVWERRFTVAGENFEFIIKKNSP